MKTRFPKMTGLMLTLMILLLLSACGADDKSNSKGEAKPDSGDADKMMEISVAVVNDFPPFEFIDGDELTGFDIDIIEAIASKVNIEVDWKIMKFDGIVPALQAKQVEAAVSAIGITDERLEVVDFSDTYFESGLALTVHIDSEIASEEDLEGKLLVAKQGTSSLIKANELAEKYNGKVKVLQDDVSLYMEVELGNSDAMINDFPSVAYKLKKDGDDAEMKILGEPLTGENYGIAIVKDNDELVERLNRGLKELRDSGEYEEIFDKYFSTK